MHICVSASVAILMDSSMVVSFPLAAKLVSVMEVVRIMCIVHLVNSMYIMDPV